jgi:hypothetical protein
VAAITVAFASPPTQIITIPIYKVAQLTYDANHSHLFAYLMRSLIFHTLLAGFLIWLPLAITLPV